MFRAAGQVILVALQIAKADEHCHADGDKAQNRYRTE